MSWFQSTSRQQPPCLSQAQADPQPPPLSLIPGPGEAGELWLGAGSSGQSGKSPLDGEHSGWQIRAGLFPGTLGSDRCVWSPEYMEQGDRQGAGSGLFPNPPNGELYQPGWQLSQFTPWESCTEGGGGVEQWKCARAWEKAMEGIKEF